MFTAERNQIKTKQMKPSLVIYSLIIFILLCFTSTIQSQTVRINEIMAGNSSVLADYEQDFTDWIELYNEGNASVNLSGWSLSDDQDHTDKWKFENVTLGPDKYLIVFASGKDKVMENGEIHCNFKLSRQGEYLGLYSANGTMVSEISPAFQEMNNDQSLGLMDSNWVLFSDPTPGSANNSKPGRFIDQPIFSHEHDYYDNPFQLIIANQSSSGTIYYTTDGSEPSRFDKSYTKPLEISSTTILRAKTIDSDGSESRTTTRSYLFVEDIIHQSNKPSGYPSNWGNYVELSGSAIADYEMDPDLTADPNMAERIKEALKSLPVISLVSDKDNFFSRTQDAENGGIYIFTGPPGNEIGMDWERPVSFEYFDPNDTSSLQVDCGIRLHGGHSRRPEKCPKHAFSLKFRSKYGPSRLEYKLFQDTPIKSFDDLTLRAGFGNTWVHWTSEERERAQYLRDTWSKDTQRDMGYPASHGNFAHLYINGMYWGIYNPNETVNGEFASSYFGGESDDYDIIKDLSETVEGNRVVWSEMFSLANKGLESDEDFYFIQGKNPDGTRNPEYISYIDIENLIDYMLLNFYGGNTDWDHHNWVAIRSRKQIDIGFQFFAWDQEHVLKSLEENTTGEFNASCPSHIFQRLTENKTFRRIFADRVLKHCFYGGLLTPEVNAERYLSRSDVMEKAIDAESARWGDYRRDVHAYHSSGPFALYNKDEHWIPAKNFLLDNYFPLRTDMLIEQLRQAGLFPELDAPYVLINGKNTFNEFIKKGDRLQVRANEGTVYYTIDGTDPVHWENGKGTPSANAKRFGSTIVLDQSVWINARAYSNGEWSALQDKFLGIIEDYDAIKITEINYHPVSESGNSDNYEFVELKNTGTATLNLKGLKFIDGIDFEFKYDYPLQPGQFAVLASNTNKYNQRYGKPASGEYSGNLANDGELLVLVNAIGDTICMVEFSDNDEWPVLADGFGPSLVPTDFNPVGSQNNANSWRASLFENGSPFGDDKEDYTKNNELTIGNGFVNITGFPNPFNEVVMFDIEADLNSKLNLTIYNAQGAKVTNLISNGGTERLTWDGTNASGNNCPAGLYIVKVNSSNQLVKTFKLIKTR